MHATPFELEQYVGARLGPDESAELERHCDACDACAVALSREARLELSLRRLFAEQRCGRSAELLPPQGEGARRAGGASRPSLAVLESRSHRPRRAGLFLLAAAACVTLAFFTARLPSHHSVPNAPALTTDAGDAFHVSPHPPRVWLDGDLAHGTP